MDNRTQQLLTERKMKGAELARMIAEITGDDFTRQAVNAWVRGVQPPGKSTLKMLVLSPATPDWMREWAVGCLADRGSVRVNHAPLNAQTMPIDGA
jgi:hypothetical protein